MDKLMTIVMPTDVWTTVSDYLFESMCVRGVTKYKYMLNTFVKNIGYTKNKHLLELKHCENMIYKITCSSNKGMIKYLYDLGKLSKNDIVCNNALQYASKNGNLDTLNYITKTFKLNKGDYALICASVNGHLEIVKYLVETYKFDYDGTIDDVLICASASGHLEIVKYLTETCRLNRTGTIDYALTYASANGHQEIIKYMSTVSLTRVDTAPTRRI